jgi:hypothetical protein
MDEPVLRGGALVDEAKLFQEIARKHARLPKFVKRIGFRFGEDSTGDPAVWIRLFTPEDLNPSKAKIAALRRVVDEIRSDILASGSERWPYYEIVTE